MRTDSVNQLGKAFALAVPGPFRDCVPPLVDNSTYAPCIHRHKPSSFYPVPHCTVRIVALLSTGRGRIAFIVHGGMIDWFP